MTEIAAMMKEDSQTSPQQVQPGVTMNKALGRFAKDGSATLPLPLLFGSSASALHYSVK